MKDIYLVSDLIDVDLPKDETELQLYVSEVQEYINKLNLNNVEALYERGDKVTAKETFEFFRSQGRIENTKLIIQYLIAFLDKIPLEEDIAKEQVNPFKQFKLFVLKSARLLEEKDVKDSIINELSKDGLLNSNNLWYYRGRIYTTYKKIKKKIEMAESPSYDSYKKLFEILMELSKFWFMHRNENFKKIRKSDIHTYKLAAILSAKIDAIKKA